MIQTILLTFGAVVVLAIVLLGVIVAGVSKEHAESGEWEDFE